MGSGTMSGGATMKRSMQRPPSVDDLLGGMWKMDMPVDDNRMTPSGTPLGGGNGSFKESSMLSLPAVDSLPSLPSLTDLQFLADSPTTGMELRGSSMLRVASFARALGVMDDDEGDHFTASPMAGSGPSLGMGLAMPMSHMQELGMPLTIPTVPAPSSGLSGRHMGQGFRMAQPYTHGSFSRLQGVEEETSEMQEAPTSGAMAGPTAASMRMPMPIPGAKPLHMQQLQQPQAPLQTATLQAPLPPQQQNAALSPVTQSLDSYASPPLFPRGAVAPPKSYISNNRTLVSSPSGPVNVQQPVGMAEAIANVPGGPAGGGVLVSRPAPLASGAQIRQSAFQATAMETGSMQGGTPVSQHVAQHPRIPSHIPLQSPILSSTQSVPQDKSAQLLVPPLHPPTATASYRPSSASAISSGHGARGQAHDVAASLPTATGTTGSTMACTTAGQTPASSDVDAQGFGNGHRSDRSHKSGSGSEDDGVNDQRRARRMLSNRESARRSRQRKQHHLEELRNQAQQLRMENANVQSKLQFATRHYTTLQDENHVLRAEVVDLQRRLQQLREAVQATGGGRPGVGPVNGSSGAGQSNGAQGLAGTSNGNLNENAPALSLQSGVSSVTTATPMQGHDVAPLDAPQSMDEGNAERPNGPCPVVGAEVGNGLNGVGKRR